MIMVFGLLRPISRGDFMRLSCKCGNTENLAAKMEGFDFEIVRISNDSKTIVIAVKCRRCGAESEKILLGA